MDYAVSIIINIFFLSELDNNIYDFHHFILRNFHIISSFATDRKIKDEEIDEPINSQQNIICEVQSPSQTSFRIILMGTDGDKWKPSLKVYQRCKGAGSKAQTLIWHSLDDNGLS